MTLVKRKRIKGSSFLIKTFKSVVRILIKAFSTEDAFIIILKIIHQIILLIVSIKGRLIYNAYVNNTFESVKDKL